MKKFLCVVLALLFTGSFAFANEIDLSALSNDELVALKDDVERAISERGLANESPFYPGVYVCGESIKPGDYDLRIVKPDGLGYVHLYETKDDYDNENCYYEYFISDDSVACHVTLKEGTVMYIRFSGELRISSNKPDWAM